MTNQIDCVRSWGLAAHSASEAEHAAIGRRDANAAQLGRLNMVGEHPKHGDLALHAQQRVHLNQRRRQRLLPRQSGESRGRAGGGNGDGVRLRGGGRGEGECGDGEAGGHVLCAAAFDLACGDVHGADLAARVAHAEGAVVVRERRAVGVAHGGELLEGEGGGAVHEGEGRELHGGHGDGGRARAEEDEERGRGAAGREEEEERGHDAGAHRG